MARIRTTKSGLRYEINDYGCVDMYGVKTLKRYHALNEERNSVDCYKHHCFFAFSKEQFEQGKRNAHIPEGEKILSAGAGLYGTDSGLDAYAAEVMSFDARIKAECDPQEVYFYEYNNHECGLSGDEYIPFNLICRIWGRETAESLTRLS